MNIYCDKCGKELEIKEDLGSVVTVFGHICELPLVDDIEALDLDDGLDDRVIGDH